MSTKAKKKKSPRDYVLQELKEEVLQMEASTSHGDVREALRQVVAKIEAHQINES